MDPRFYDPFGFERGPEASGEEDKVSKLAEGYIDLGRVEAQTFDTVSDDLIDKIRLGEITEDQAKAVLAQLGYQGF